MGVVMVMKAVVLLIMLLPFWAKVSGIFNIMHACTPAYVPLPQLGEAVLNAMHSVSPKLEALGAMLLMPFFITVCPCCAGVPSSRSKLELLLGMCCCFVADSQAARPGDLVLGG